MAAAGISRILGLVLAPHYSRLSVGEYATRATAAAANAGVELAMVESWHLAPGYLELLAGFVRAQPATDVRR
ncbi:MAG: ferrochelatase [Acidimicrobiales bacterium]